MSSPNPPTWKTALFVVVGLATLAPVCSSAVALLLGAAFALTLGNPVPTLTKRWTSRLLQGSVVALGFGIDLLVVGKVGAAGVGYTVVTIGFALGAGLALGALLRLPRDVSLLVSCGTAICGGSAIAAVSGAIKAKHEHITVSLAVVFLLNATALFVFPPIGHALGLSPEQFGLWSALAVHDTSSVLGTAAQFGGKAIEVGTTVKLARALWITPLTLVISYVYARRAKTEGGGKVTMPWFILGFILASALCTFVPGLREPGKLVASVGVRLLVFVLFLIGAGLSRATLKAVGLKPLAQGVLLWALVASTTLYGLSAGLIKL